MNNGNGKWQLAFWLITVICGSWLLTLTLQVVASDKDTRAREIVITKDFNSKVDLLIKENNTDHTCIKEKLVELKTLIRK